MVDLRDKTFLNLPINKHRQRIETQVSHSNKRLMCEQCNGGFLLFQKPLSPIKNKSLFENVLQNYYQNAFPLESNCNSNWQILRHYNTLCQIAESNSYIMKLVLEKLQHKINY